MVALRAGARITRWGMGHPQDSAASTFALRASTYALRYGGQDGGNVAASCDSPLSGSWDSAFSLVRLGPFGPS